MLSILTCHFVAFIPWGLEQEPGWRGSFFVTIDQFFGQIGVCYFFVLSGFFLTKRKFRWQRIARTIIQTFLYSVFLLLLSFALHTIKPGFMGETLQWTRMEIAQRIYKGLMPVFNNQYWFITAYIIMLLFSPFVNLLFEYCNRCQIISLMVLLASFSLLPFISFCGLKYNGLFWSPATYAVLCYMVGGYLAFYQKQKPLGGGHALLLVAASGGISFTVLFLFIFIAQQQFKISRFFAWTPRSIFGTIPLVPISFVAVLLASMLNSKIKQHDKRYTIIINGLASTVFGIYLIHQNQSIGQLTWILASKISPVRPNGVLSLGGFSCVIIIIVFIILALMAWTFDHIIVYPIQNALIHLIENYYFNNTHKIYAFKHVLNNNK